MARLKSPRSRGLFLFLLLWLVLPAGRAFGERPEVGEGSPHACNLDLWRRLVETWDRAQFFVPPPGELSGNRRPTITIMSFGQKLLRDPGQVQQYKDEMLSGKFDYRDEERRVDGAYSPERRAFYVGEGHHRFAAALEIAYETGDWRPFNQLVAHGRWEIKQDPPASPSPLLARTRWWNGPSWARFLAPFSRAH